MKQNERLSILNGVASTVVQNISGNYISLFAISILGATNYQVGLISSLPQFIGMFAMILASFLLSKVEEKKKFTALSVLFTRLFMLLMVLIMYVPEQYRSWTFVILIGLMNFPGAFANLSWQSFIGDLIPDTRRNSFFSERNRVLTIVGMISTLIIGVILQQFDPTNPIPFQALFLISFLFGIIEVYYLFKHIETKKDRKPKEKVERKRLSLNFEIYKDKRYLAFLICSVYFNIGWQMAWSLFNIYQIKYAHATGLWISLFMVANSVSQVVSYKWWGRMADKHGNAKMLIFASIGMASAPVLTILTTNLYFLVATNLFVGLFVSGTVLLLFNMLLEVTKEENRSTYIANYNVILAIVGFIAPQFGVYLLEVSSIELSMITSSILRASSCLVFLWFYLYLKRNFKTQKQITEIH